MKREIFWGLLDSKKFEHLKLFVNDNQIIADGFMLHLGEDSIRARYRMQFNSGWKIEKVEIERLDDSSNSIILYSDTKGNWTDHKNNSIPELNGCTDIDIHFSPFTNTPAIKKLKLKEGEFSVINVAFISVKEMSVVPVKQKYTYIKEEQGKSIYRYESLESSFKVNLPVDGDGLLIEYPGFFKRLWYN